MAVVNVAAVGLEAAVNVAAVVPPVAVAVSVAPVVPPVATAVNVDAVVPPVARAFRTVMGGQSRNTPMMGVPMNIPGPTDMANHSLSGSRFANVMMPV